MRKFGFVFLLVVSLLIGYSMYDKFSEAKNFEYQIIENNNDQQLKVGVIGDSWVHRIDSITLRNHFLKNGMYVEPLIKGYPGATSKMIYTYLFEPENIEFIIKNRPQYCIIIAGVNDSFRGFGKDFYATHMLKIIETLNHYNIKPVILEIPNFGIEESQNNRNKIGIYRDNIWFFIKNENFKDIETYRMALRQRLTKSQLINNVILIKSTDINLDYKTHNKLLYSDPLHLNPKGYKILLDVLVQKIKKDIETQNQ